jgi:uncharacterized DUF497 family protein
MKRIIWKSEKNEKLKRERGVSFEDVLLAIETGDLITIERHSKPRYNHQYLMIVLINGYPHEIPFIETEEDLELITIFPNRNRKKSKRKREL